jgi:nucleoside 2-deoxyribosyltransferase
MTVLSPLRGKDMTKSKDGGLSTPDQGSKSIIIRDYNDIKRADVMLVNLNLWGSTRPLVGTLMELAWAWQMQMPVVAVCAKDDVLMRNHPFINECISHYCETMAEAIEFIGRYYA